MRFLVMHKLDQHDPSVWSPTPQLIADMGAFMREAMESGVLLGAEGVLPPAKDGALLRFSGGESTVTDGPFAEAKEVVAGYAVFSVGSREEALEWAARFGRIIGGDIEVEVRRITEFSDFDDDLFPDGYQADGQKLRDQMPGA